MSELEGTILAVCVGAGGIPKHAVEAARATAAGVEGDHQRYRFHGGPRRALCLFSIEDYDALAQDGVVAAPPGAYGENVLTRGLDFRRLHPGDRLQLGDEVEIELDDVREPCKTLKSVDARFPRLMLGRSGFVCRVLREGVLRAGQTVRKL